jgi:hypothetical protein
MPGKPSQIPKQADSIGYLATGEHRHEMASEWQASVFWDRAQERLMRLYCSEALSHFVAERHYSWLESYMGWLEGKEERLQYHALLEEELASLRMWGDAPPPISAPP